MRSDGDLMETVRDGATRMARFFDTRIWLVRLADLRKGKAALYRVSRILYTTWRGFRDQGLTFRAAALTYFSVLSIVPFLAVAFSMLKGFGAYTGLIEGTVRPYLRNTFGGNPALLKGIDSILVFVEKTDVSALGNVGLLFFIYTAISLLSNIETALNDIWGVKSKRPFLRQVTDYTTLLVTTPLLMLVAVTFGSAAGSSGIVHFLRENPALGPVIDFFFLRLTSLVLAAMAMTALYLILPNVRVRFASAALGGAVSGVLWQLSLIAHVQFQMGVAKYNALYSALGALPIFLVWTYVSWLILLFGAQLAASHQNEQAVRQMLRARHADQSLKETLAIAVASLVTRDFLDGCPRRTQEELAEALEVPPPTMGEILEALVRNNVLAKAVTGTEIGYLPGRDVDEVHLMEVRDAIRRDPAAADLKETIERQLGPDLQRLLADLERELVDSPLNFRLRELARFAPRRPRATAAPEAPAVLDAKQPEVPA